MASLMQGRECGEPLRSLRYITEMGRQNAKNTQINELFTIHMGSTMRNNVYHDVEEGEEIFTITLSNKIEKFCILLRWQV